MSPPRSPASSRLSAIRSGMVEHGFGLVRRLKRLDLFVVQLELQSTQRVGEVVGLRRADDRRADRLVLQDPGKGDLHIRHASRLGNGFDRLYHRVVRLAVVEARRELVRAGALGIAFAWIRATAG